MSPEQIVGIILKFLPFLEHVGEWIVDLIKKHQDHDHDKDLVSLSLKPELATSLQTVIDVLEGVLSALKKFQAIFAPK